MCPTQAAALPVIFGALLLLLAYFFTAVLHGQAFYVAATLVPYYFMLPTFVMVRGAPRTTVVRTQLCR